MKTTTYLLLGTAAAAVTTFGCSAPSGDVQRPGEGVGGAGSGSGGGSGLLVGTGGGLLATGGTSGTGLGSGLLRDFSCSGFPDISPCDEPGLVTGETPKTCASDVRDHGTFVGPTLGADGKPVYMGEPVWSAGTLTTFGALHPSCNGQPCFNYWFNTVPGVNLEFPWEIPFECPTGSAVCSYYSPAFFPLDGQGFGADCAVALHQDHNYGFTFEFHATFTYQAGLQFTFKGDDDVFVFINGAKVIDIGGLHPEYEASVPFNDLALTPGQLCTLDFFFAERNPTESNFRIDLSPELMPDIR